MALPVPGLAQDSWLDELAATLWEKPQFSMVPIDYEAVPVRPYAGPPPGREGLRVVFVGIPSDYGTAFLLHLVQRRVNLATVVCSTRWQRTHPKADLLARIAGHIGRPVEVAANANAESLVRSLRAYEPDLVVMASFDQILSAETLRIPKIGWMNIHPSLLPRHRGPEPLYWTIAKGDPEGGITLHWAVPRIDAGPILAQRRTPVAADDTSGTLCKRLVSLGIDALDETLDRLASGNAATTPPAVSAGSYEPPVRPAEIDWNLPSEHVERLVRAGQPDQPPFGVWRGERLYLLSLTRVRDRRHERPGILEDAGEGRVLAVLGDAVVEFSASRTGHSHALRPLRHQEFP
jgi:methionyl-tRNA formyltransferase